MLYLLIALMAQNGISSAVMAPTISQLNEEVSAMADRYLQKEVVLKPLNTKLEEYYDQNLAGTGTWSITVLMPETEDSIMIGADEQQTAASSVKLFLACAVMENYDAITQTYGKDVIDSLLEATLIISDNAAADDLIFMLGNGSLEAGKNMVNQFCQDHGYSNTYLGIVFNTGDPTGTYNATSSKDMAQCLSDLYNGRIAKSDWLLSVLERSERVDKIPSVLPEGVRSANKTGELLDTENDTALIYGQNEPYILSVMASDVDVFIARQKIQEISSLVWNELEEPQEQTQ